MPAKGTHLQKCEIRSFDVASSFAIETNRGAPRTVSFSLSISKFIDLWWQEEIQKRKANLFTKKDL
jgi:hypothetical protein